VCNMGSYILLCYFTTLDVPTSLGVEMCHTRHLRHEPVVWWRHAARTES